MSRRRDLVVGVGVPGAKRTARAIGAAFEPYQGRRLDGPELIVDIAAEFLEGRYARLAVIRACEINTPLRDLFVVCPGALPQLTVVTLDPPAARRLCESGQDPVSFLEGLERLVVTTGDPPLSEKDERIIRRRARRRKRAGR